MTRTTCLVATLGIVATAGLSPAQTDALRVEMDAIAKEAADILKSYPTPINEVRVGDFAGPQAQKVSGGPAIALALTESLPKHGIRVSPDAAVSIVGEYEDVKDPPPQPLLFVQVSATVVDRTGKKLFECTKRGAFGEALVAGMHGAVVTIPPNLSAKERAKIIEDAIDHPACHVTGPTVQCSADAKYAVQILVASNGSVAYAPRPARVEGNRAFVTLTRDERFGVRLINNSDYDAAAALTLDGLSMYAFSKMRNTKGDPRYNQVIIDKGKASFIEGWHITNEQSDRFTITEYAKSAAFELKSKAPTGAIQVTFAAAWPEGSPRPADEPVDAHRFSRSAGPDAIGRGQRFDKKYAEVRYDVGVVRETVIVRYQK
ncbi:MAG: hypothetical protein U0746_20495 [Gemmataceae bacterium]